MIDIIRNKTGLRLGFNDKVKINLSGRNVAALGCIISLWLVSLLSPLQEKLHFGILLCVYLMIALCSYWSFLLSCRIRIKNSRWTCALLLFLICCVYNNKDMLIGGIASHLFVRTIICFLIVFPLVQQKEWFLVIPKCLFISTFIHTIATLVFFVMPGLWHAYSRVVFHGVVSGTANERGYTAALNGHYSTNATLISFCILACCAYVFTSKKKKKWIIMTGISYLALLLTTKRAHLLFTIATILVMYFVINWNENSFKTIFKMIIIGALAVTAFVICAKYIPAVTAVLERFATAGEDNSSAERFAMWKEALKMFWKHPIIGNGWGSFKYTASFVGKNDNVLNAHNIYIQLLAENGIIGLALFCGLAFSNLFRLMKILYRSDFIERDSTLYRVGLLSVMMQLFILFYGITGNCLYDLCLIYYAVALACGESILIHINAYKVSGLLNKLVRN